MFLRLSVLIAGVLTLTALASVSRATNILVAPGFEVSEAHPTQPPSTSSRPIPHPERLREEIPGTA